MIESKAGKMKGDEDKDEEGGQAEVTELGS